VVTGPTRTNVNDFRAVLILPRQDGGMDGASEPRLFKRG